MYLRSVGRLFAACLVTSSVWSSAGLVSAQAAPYEFASQAVERSLIVVANQTKVLEFSSDVGQAIVGDPATADVLPVSARTLYIQGKKLGTTNLTIFSGDRSQQILFSVQVTPDIAALKRAFAEVAPGVDVKITPSSGRLILTGMVPDGAIADRLVQVAKDFTENVTNAMVITSNQQVMLEVWFLEADRTVSKQLGLNVGGANGKEGFSSNPLPLGAIEGASKYGLGTVTGVISGMDIAARIDALESKGLVRRLANPNLVALSGKKANFNAGGKIPYQTVGGNGQPNIQFINYGVNLVFLPTIVTKDFVNLEVSAGVSSPQLIEGASAGPGLSERIAETAVELRNGEALMIAGLSDVTVNRDSAQTPVFGDIPVLGALFRNSSYLNKETELVIIVAPRTVDPARNLRSFRSPLNSTSLTEESDFFMNGVSERSYAVPPSGAVPLQQMRAPAEDTRARAGGAARPSRYGHMIDDSETGE